MRELKIENQLKDTQLKLYHWVSLLLRDNINVTNIAEWMLQEANRIQIILEIK